MDNAVVEQKLESLRRCVQRVETRVPESLEALQSDLDAQDIIALNLTRAIQLCVDMASHWLAENAESHAPTTMGQTFQSLAQAGMIDHALATRLIKSVGFRNVMVHSYDEIDWAIVFAIARYHLDDFKAFARVFSST